MRRVQNTTKDPQGPDPQRPAGGLRAKDKLLLALHLPLVVVLVTPLVPSLWSADSALFGLPRSIVTMIGLLACSFVAVLIHFRSDRSEVEGSGEEAS